MNLEGVSPAASSSYQPVGGGKRRRRRGDDEDKGPPRKRRGKCDEDKSSDDPPICEVCLAAFTQETRVGYMAGCKHGFCLFCIERWTEANNTCPKCRRVCGSYKICSSLNGAYERRVRVRAPIPEPSFAIPDLPFPGFSLPNVRLPLSVLTLNQLQQMGVQNLGPRPAPEPPVQAQAHAMALAQAPPPAQLNEPPEVEYEVIIVE